MNRRTPRIALGLCALLLALVGYFRLTRPQEPGTSTFVRVRELAALHPRRPAHRPHVPAVASSTAHSENGSGAREGRVVDAQDIYAHTDLVDQDPIDGRGALRDGAASSGADTGRDRRRFRRHRAAFRHRRSRHSAGATVGRDAAPSADGQPPAADRPESGREDHAAGRGEGSNGPEENRGGETSGAGRSDGTWEHIDPGAGRGGDSGGPGEGRNDRSTGVDRSTDPDDR